MKKVLIYFGIVVAKRWELGVEAAEDRILELVVKGTNC